MPYQRKRQTETRRTYCSPWTQFHESLPIHTPKAMHTWEARAAAYKELDNFLNLPDRQEFKVRNKEVIEQASTENNTVYLATRLDLCHLKHSEWDYIPDAQRARRCA